MSWFEHAASRIFYEECGKGDPVLLLPGFTQSFDDLSAFRDALAARYRVIAADLPGSGRSEPQPRQYTPTYFKEDAGAFTALLHNLKAEPAHLIGFSDGGEVALLMAERTPTVARSVVTWGASGTFSDPDGHLRRTMYNLIDHPIPPLQGFRDHLVARYGEANARAMTQSQTTALGSIMDSGGDLSVSKAGNITCPALLIVGEQDMFVPFALIEKIAARIGKAETLEIKDAGHDAHNANPGVFAQTVLDWLKRSG